MNGGKRPDRRGSRRSREWNLLVRCSPYPRAGRTEPVEMWVTDLNRAGLRLNWTLAWACHVCGLRWKRGAAGECRPAFCPFTPNETWLRPGKRIRIDTLERRLPRFMGRVAWSVERPEERRWELGVRCSARGMGRVRECLRRQSPVVR